MIVKGAKDLKIPCDKVPQMQKLELCKVQQCMTDKLSCGFKTCHLDFVDSNLNSSRQFVWLMIHQHAEFGVNMFSSLGYDYVTFKPCDLDVKEGNPIFLHGTPSSDETPTYQV